MPNRYRRMLAFAVLLILLTSTGVTLAPKLAGGQESSPYAKYFIWDYLMQPMSPEMEAKIRRFMGQHIPQIANARLVNSKICLYTMTPDEHFVIDRHPVHPHIVIGAGFSGHGFKFSTLIGKLLADLSSQNPIDLDLSMFRIDRF